MFPRSNRSARCFSLPHFTEESINCTIWLSIRLEQMLMFLCRVSYDIYNLYFVYVKLVDMHHACVGYLVKVYHSSAVPFSSGTNTPSFVDELLLVEDCQCLTCRVKH